jgi:UDP-N-acetylglucosamine 3-dehydrogenase
MKGNKIFKSMSKLNVAVIGVGNMGQHHCRAFSIIQDVNLLAVSDINEKVGRKIAKKYICRYYKDYRDMLNKEYIDAVSIAVPTRLHKKVSLDVIKFKKHLLVEKPIASTVEDAKRIIEEAKLAGVKLMVGHIERFNPAVQELKKIIQRGKLGEIISVIAKRVGMFPPQIKDTNVIIDLAVHDIDIFNYLLDKQPVEVFAKGRKTLTNHREDSAEIFLSYGETSGFIQVNWITPVKIRTLSVTGSKGYAELNYITQKLELYQSRYKKRVDNFGEFVIKFGEPIKKEIKINKKEPLLCELESFVKCIKEDTQVEVTGEDGLKALLIAERALQSLKYENSAKRL